MQYHNIQLTQLASCCYHCLFSFAFHFSKSKCHRKKTWIGTLHCSLDETTLKNKILGQTYLLFLHHTLHTNNYQQYQQQLINWNSTTNTPALSNMETSQQWLTEVSYNQNLQDRTPTFQSNCRYLSFQRQYGKNACWRMSIIYSRLTDFS